MSVKNLLFILLLIVLLSCGQSNTPKVPANTSAQPTKAVVSTVSTTFSVAQGIVAELDFADSVKVQVNGNHCFAQLNIPKDFNANATQIEVTDYNFDGYNDFAIVYNLAYHINLFDTVTQNFIPFETLISLEVDTVYKRLTSVNNGLSSPSTKVFEIHSVYNNTLILQESIEQVPALYAVGNDKVYGDLTIVETPTYYNTSSGKPLTGKRKLQNDNGQTASYTVESEKLYLYRAANKNAKTSMYFVKGDTVELLDFVWTNKDKDQPAEGFFQVLFKSPKHGDIVKWIRYNENGIE